jgi:C4-dicarboxylate-specific signal transduction histidine kinase
MDWIVSKPRPEAHIDATLANASTQASVTPEQELLEQLLAIARASALEEMASGIAHELNQPLGAIVTFAQTAERMLNRPEPMIAEAHNVLRLISKEALEASDGIRHIRRLFNREDLNRQPYSMANLVRELVPILELLAVRSGGRLEVDLSDNVPEINVDKLRIQHVLFTLVQNAFEATDQTRDGHVKLSVTGDRYGAKVTISDNGSGVAPAQRQEIFHPFFTTKSNGTGLGLASARAIIEAHQGSIAFEPSAHAGACFWFQLPAA